MADTQTIFDVLNMSQTGPRPPKPNGLDPDKRHYQCVETTCSRIYEIPANGRHVTISVRCPEMFDRLTLSYKLGKFVTRQ
jgi:hypothetical protein